MVGKPGGEGREGFIAEVASAVSAACQSEVLAVAAKDRLGGKFVSVHVTVRLRAPEMIDATQKRLLADGRIKMAY